MNSPAEKLFQRTVADDTLDVGVKFVYERVMWCRSLGKMHWVGNINGRKVYDFFGNDFNNYFLDNGMLHGHE